MKFFPTFSSKQAVEQTGTRSLWLPKLFPLFLLALLMVSNAFGADSPIPEVETASELTWKGWFTIFLFLAIFAALIAERWPPELVMLFGASLLVITGIITPQQFISGFGQDIIFTLALLCVVVRSMELAGILHFLMKKGLPSTKIRELQFLTLLPPLSFFSAFLNNTPIVLMLTPLIRNWVRKIGSFPSRYLIPVSFATILGGACTLIGTSTNMIVFGILNQGPNPVSLGFFEIGLVGLPCAIVGLAYLILFSHRLLPDRKDPSSSIEEQAKEFTAEFVVTEEFESKGMALKQIGPIFFGALMIEIERNGLIIESPRSTEQILEGDRLVFAGDMKQIAEIHTLEGIRSAADPHFELDTSSSHFSEVIVAATSSIVGRTLRQVDFKNNYGASVIAVYRQGTRISGPLANVPLLPGDTLMLYSENEDWYKPASETKEFFFLTQSEKLPLFVPWKAAAITLALIAMIVATTMGVPMLLASFWTAFFLVATKSISIREAKRGIQWNLLVLIASAFSLGMAMESTGVATFMAEHILAALGNNPQLLIAGLFAATLVVTEIITNNAAALLILPIALRTVTLAGYTSPDAFKAVGVTVALAATSSFLTPIGYQTNTIVYGPGGYRFGDYFRVGAPLTVIVFTLATYLIPRIWPLVPVGT